MYTHTHTHTHTHAHTHTHTQVKWETEWWQAKIKKVKVDKSTDKIEKVYVSYVGGTADEDEWIAYSSKRLRPPTIGFTDTTSGR